MKDGKIWGCPAPTHAEVERLRTALAQAEREREFERERADNQHEAAEMFQNQYREALQERDHSRGLVNGLIAERNDARAEVERLKAEFIAAIPKCSTDVTDFQMARLAAQGWKIRAEQAEADLARVRAAWPWPFQFPE